MELYHYWLSWGKLSWRLTSLGRTHGKKRCTETYIPTSLPVSNIQKFLEIDREAHIFQMISKDVQALKFYYEYVLLTQCPWYKLIWAASSHLNQCQKAFSFFNRENVKVKKDVFPWFWCGVAERRRQVTEAHLLGRKVASILHGRWFSVGGFSSSADISFPAT